MGTIALATVALCNSFQHHSLSGTEYLYANPDNHDPNAQNHLSDGRLGLLLLWQLAYTELYFTDCYWPDFGDEQFQLALDDFAKRQRRYGSHDNQKSMDA